MKHTKGPWFVGENSDNDGNRILLICAENLKFENKAIAKVLDANMARGTKCFLPGDANARLIAAAPELLEALERLVAWAIVYGDDLENNIEFSLAKKVVAKATGGAE